MIRTFILLGLLLIALILHYLAPRRVRDLFWVFWALLVMYLVSSGSLTLLCYFDARSNPVTWDGASTPWEHCVQNHWLFPLYYW